MKSFFTIVYLLFSSTLIAQITVNNTQNAQDLVQLLFNNSGCASISNFSVSGNDSYASFNKNGSNFPFENGIVLCTGFTNHISGPNTSLSDDDLGTPNDADMNAHFTDTFDTTVLEFDFIPSTNYMSFEYLFASEEYQENNGNTCVYSDVFAFLIKANSDSNYTNIAIVPNTSIPVQVTSVHPAINDSCQADNEAYFGQWNSQTDATIPINYNGQTTVLKAESMVVPNTLYHIKLIIADHANYRYDSAVFLKAGSFNVGTNLGNDRLRSTQNALCGSESLILDSGYTTATSYKWYVDTLPYDGVFTQLAGANSSTYTVTAEGKYKVEVDLGAGCISEGQITIEYDVLPTVYDSDLRGCNNDLSDFYTFNLSDANAIITNNDNSLFVENYYHSLDDAIFQANPIQNLHTYTNQFIDEEVFAHIENQSGCVRIAKITLKVYHDPELLDDEIEYYCLNTSPNTITLNSGLVSGNPSDYSFEWFFDDGVNPSVNLNQNTETIEILYEGVYTVEVANSDGCTAYRNLTVIYSNIATVVDVVVSETLFPDRISIKINAIGEGDYEYSIDNHDFQESPIFNNLLYGYHIISIKDKHGCLENTQKEITILKYQKFFTPNKDSQYDYWNLNNINSLLTHYNTISDLTIYDRFGKVMAVINPNSQGWNGFYKGTLAFPSDYWFSVKLIDFNGKVTTKKGHFSLVR